MLIINPGSGPVHGATEDNAKTNLEAMARDPSERGQDASVVVGALLDQEDGRWTGALLVDGRMHEVDMPGLPLEEVRYLGEEDQNIWDFPRMYVDGSSWVWKYALGMFRADEDDE